MADAFDGYNDWREQNGMDRMDDAFKHANDWGKTWNDHKNVHDLGQLGKPARQDNGRVSPGNDAGRSNWMPTQRSLFGGGGRSYNSDCGTTSGQTDPRYTCAGRCGCQNCAITCVYYCIGNCAEYDHDGELMCSCPR